MTCPWHGAKFSAKTGDIEDAPALDSLLSFPIEQDNNGDLYVEADEEQLKGKPGRPVECASKVKESGSKGLVIVGGGSATIHAVESARKNGYDGKITIISSEKHPSYDRTKLSKALIGDPDALIWRSPSHLKNVLKADYHASTTVQSISLSDQSIKTDKDQRIEYDYLLLATGGSPKRLPIPGAKEGELKNVEVLRTLDHVGEILSKLGDKGEKDVVVVGTSFIGLETALAASGQKKSKSVTLVGPESVPLEGILGPEVGKGIKQSLEKNNGLKFYMGSSVEKLEGDGTVSSVEIKDSNGKEISLKADLVLLGVGVSPATGYLKDSPGFPELEKDGSLLVDSELRVQNLAGGANNVFAAGDIATMPSFDGKQKIRIEHWNVAGNHGRAIGETIAKGGKGQPYTKLPIFWSSATGGQLRFVSDGNPAPSSKDHIIHVDGKVEDGSFVAYYSRKEDNGTICALASMGRDPVMAHSAELMKLGKMPSIDEVKKGTDPLSVKFD